MMWEYSDGTWVQISYSYPFDHQEIKNKLIELQDKMVILQLLFSRTRILDGDAKASIPPLADEIDEIDSLQAVTLMEISTSPNVDFNEWSDAHYDLEVVTMESFSCVYEGLFSSNRPERDTITPPPPPPPIEDLIGIDISHHQGEMDWSIANNKVDFAFIRATYGVPPNGLTDRELQRNASRVRIPFGFYHFYRPGQNWAAQLDYFLDAITGYYDFNLPLVVDLEETISTVRALPEGLKARDLPQKAWAGIRYTLTPASLAEDIRKFLEALEYRTGTKPMIYTSDSYWRYLGSPSWGSNYFLWIANWRDNPPPIWPKNTWNDWAFWQDTSSGHGPTYGAKSARIDLNRVNRNDLTPYLVEYDPPSSAPTFDLRDYYAPANNQELGPIVMLDLAQGGQERTQLQFKDNVYYLTKGFNHEKRIERGGYLDLVLDTSPGNNEYYINGNDFPVLMQLGEIYTLTGDIAFYRKHDCQPVPGKSYTETSQKRISQHLATWTSEKSRVTVADVIILQWLIEGRVVEERWLAKHLGLVRWFNEGREISWIASIVPATDQEPNPIITPDCL